ncbi:MAG: endopeptidase [Rickettsiaceae bacterium]|jgi:protease-4|nr:endopeptidase [Rickettsiaceae bacterium]
MSLSSDNFTALIHLRDQARKWKNVSFLMIIALLLLALHILFGASESANIDSGGDYIANIKVEGMILDDDYRSEILGKIAEQKNIKAVIVNINSPGGGIVGSEILYENLREIAKNKPIVVLMGSLAASGGYMASLASDYIIARNGTLTGSIGVLMQSSEVTDLANKLGIKFLTYKSSPLKGSPSPFEKTNPQVNQVINESIADSYKFFSDLVKERRGDRLDKKNLATIIDGRVFTGRQALKNGLIDEIGGKNEALKYLSTIHKVDIAKFPVKNIELEKPDDTLFGKLLGEEAMIKIITKVTGFNSQGGQIMSIFNF